MCQLALEIKQVGEAIHRSFKKHSPLSLFPSGLDRAGSQFYSWTTFLITPAVATPGLARTLQASQACPPPRHRGLEEVNSLEPYGGDASVPARRPGQTGALDPRRQPLRGRLPAECGRRSSHCPGSRGRRVARGPVMCPPLFQAPGPRTWVSPPPPWGPACSKGRFPQVLLPTEFKMPCRAALSGCWASPPPLPVKPTVNHRRGAGGETPLPSFRRQIPREREDRGNAGRCAIGQHPPPATKHPTAAGGGAGTARGRLPPAAPSALYPPKH